MTSLVNLTIDRLNLVQKYGIRMGLNPILIPMFLLHYWHIELIVVTNTVPGFFPPLLEFQMKSSSLEEISQGHVFIGQEEWL